MSQQLAPVVLQVHHPLQRLPLTPEQRWQLTNRHIQIRIAAFCSVYSFIYLRLLASREWIVVPKVENKSYDCCGGACRSYSWPHGVGSQRIGLHVTSGCDSKDPDCCICMSYPSKTAPLYMLSTKQCCPHTADMFMDCLQHVEVSPWSARSSDRTREGSDWTSTLPSCQSTT